MVDQQNKIIELENRIKDLEAVIDKFVYQDKYYFYKKAVFPESFQLVSGATIQTDATNGGTFGRATDKIGFLGAAPKVKITAPANPTGGSTIDAEARTAITDINTALKSYGLLAGPV